MRISTNVQTYLFGRNALKELPKIVAAHTESNECVVSFVDEYFTKSELLEYLPKGTNHHILFVSTRDEPTTSYVNELRRTTEDFSNGRPIGLLVGMGGGSALDICKAVSNLLTNPGKAERYQGWDLVQNPGVYKVGIPTLSGTGAEASRTCVLKNAEKNIKMGMNSKFTVFDQLILDPELTSTVPKEQYFYSGMDTYIHCIESLCGSHRHALSDSYSDQALKLVKQVFLSENMQSVENREKLMVASYLGGASIANTYVGVVHPLSAGLSMVLGTKHCLANCIVMNVVEEFYPAEVKLFKQMLDRQRIELPKDLCKGLSPEAFDRLYEATIVHEKPLRNALGDKFDQILSREKAISLFKRM